MYEIPKAKQISSITLYLMHIKFYGGCTAFKIGISKNVLARRLQFATQWNHDSHWHDNFHIHSIELFNAWHSTDNGTIKNIEIDLKAIIKGQTISGSDECFLCGSDCAEAVLDEISRLIEHEILFN